MTTQELKLKFEKFKAENSLMDNIFELKKELLSSDSEDILEFHYNISNDKSIKEGLRNMIKSFFSSEIENKRDKQKTAEFLYRKYENESDSMIKADILKTLGHLRVQEARILALNEIKSLNYDLRYSSIIVLGWTGTKKDLPVLNEQMLNDPDGQLRGYSATAMRQIWYNHPKSKDAIAGYICNAAPQEKNTDALTGMIITIQNLYRKKFGIKESTYGDISGNVVEAKEKMMAFLNKTIKS
jgi:hypothetical protein